MWAVEQTDWRFLPVEKKEISFIPECRICDRMKLRVREKFTCLKNLSNASSVHGDQSPEFSDSCGDAAMMCPASIEQDDPEPSS